MTTRAELVRRAVGFGALPVLSAISPLIALPILARLASVEQWSAIAVGQSVGGMGAIALSAGWSVTGAAMASQASTEHRRHELLLESLSSRLIAGAIAIPTAALIAGAITGGSLLAALSALASALTGISISWYAVGIGRPETLAIVETIPRVSTNVAAAIAAGLTHTIFVYPLATGVVAFVPVISYSVRTTRDVRQPGWLARGFSRLRRNVSALAAESVAAAYSMGATAIVGMASTAAVVADFNVGYRLTAFGSIAIGTVSNSLQGWTAEAKGDEFRRRIRVAGIAHLAVGLAGLVGLAALGPWAARVLFGDAFAPSRALLTWLGVFFLAWSLETLTGRLILAARGHTRTLFMTTATGSAIGVVAIYVLANSAGATGAAIGLAFALTTIVALQTPAAWRTVRNDHLSPSMNSEGS